MTDRDFIRLDAASGDGALTVRTASERDWPALWPILADVIDEQETFPYDPAMSQADVRSMWLVPAGPDHGRGDGRADRGDGEHVRQPPRPRITHRQRQFPGRQPAEVLVERWSRTPWCGQPGKDSLACSSTPSWRAQHCRRAALRGPRVHRHRHRPRSVRLTHPRAGQAARDVPAASLSQYAARCPCVWCGSRRRISGHSQPSGCHLTVADAARVPLTTGPSPVGVTADR